MTIETSYGKITATKETLNALSIMMSEACRSYGSRNRIIEAINANKASIKIYNELREVNYYKG